MDLYTLSSWKGFLLQKTTQTSEDTGGVREGKNSQKGNKAEEYKELPNSGYRSSPPLLEFWSRRTIQKQLTNKLVDSH